MVFAVAYLYFSAFASSQDSGLSPTTATDAAASRMGRFLLALRIAFAGTYLASRPATRHRIHRAFPRLALQLQCTTFLLPPLLCVAAFALPPLAYRLATRWDRSQANATKAR
jgi:hypothetical protein